MSEYPMVMVNPFGFFPLLIEADSPEEAERIGKAVSVGRVCASRAEAEEVVRAMTGDRR